MRNDRDGSIVCELAIIDANMASTTSPTCTKSKYPVMVLRSGFLPSFRVRLIKPLRECWDVAGDDVSAPTTALGSGLWIVTGRPKVTDAFRRNVSLAHLLATYPSTPPKRGGVSPSPRFAEPEES